jgi:hypothetical protein
VVDGASFERGGPLDPALYSPDALRNALKAAFNQGIVVRLDLDYAGNRHDWLDAPDPTVIYRWVDTLPAEPLFQRVLDAGRPQSCVH